MLQIPTSAYLFPPKLYTIFSPPTLYTIQIVLDSLDDLVEGVVEAADLGSSRQVDCFDVSAVVSPMPATGVAKLVILCSSIENRGGGRREKDVLDLSPKSTVRPPMRAGLTCLVSTVQRSGHMAAHLVISRRRPQGHNAVMMG